MNRELPPAYRRLRELTNARIALGTAGSSLGTRELLAFQYDWARARDAVYYELDFGALKARIEELGYPCAEVASAADSREIYLRRPDLGRQLAEGENQRLEGMEGAPWDVSIVVTDGLSGLAVAENAVPLIQAFGRLAAGEGLSLAPIVLARQGRVAIGDPIGAGLGAKLVVVLIGERPGLSAADSLGAYLTYGPRPGITDAERNCLSNIRDGGQAPEVAANTMMYLVKGALRVGLTGVSLKDESQLLEQGEPGIEGY
ncbi:ethanolamine ammonia-lyase [Halovibrio salipaludis]|uniref:Ethanolamine ammonia-lyase small subunit n=1 Tax=Halovibrio salipaludis TaxID=2032626 RepID=A0A2A2F7L2_9GAMM|nr:ethanolamine ammonia-lyase subunit EutC [Halovibrio salipaludis]PAU80523.1 ethanolamine ammonia-lyase [Halovibrio salipaludis]